MKLRDDARTFDTRGGNWGRNISWDRTSPPMRVHGWWTPKPRVGDRLLSDMRGGRVGVFMFTKIDPVFDPKDMFFADVEFVGYKDEGA